ncbi:hypothetical protein cypCar_00027095, partial [Cyprinus carpio]
FIPAFCIKMSGLGKLRVAVIGAGAAGLCAARHLLSRPDTFAPPVVYELTKNIGGTWVYEERVGFYDNGLPIHSSMYRDLRTNIPKEVMSFPDFPFAKHLPSFVHHTEVRKYLEQYCDHFRLWDHIQVKKKILVVAQFLFLKYSHLFLNDQHIWKFMLIA